MTSLVLREECLIASSPADVPDGQFDARSLSITKDEKSYDQVIVTSLTLG